MNLITTATQMIGGADAVTGIGMDYLIGFTGTFQTGDQITLDFTDGLTGIQTQVGAGFVTGVALQFVKTFNNKIYGVAGDSVYFCALGQPTVWNDPTAAGNDYIQMSNNYGITQDLEALAVYQGNLAVIGRQQVQIWQMDADPANNKQIQVLPHIGTVAPLSVRAVGDMDIYMLADNGVRSVRVRDASNNAIIADIGTPIDAILQPLLSALTDAQKRAACGCVEPSSNRYWVYLPNPDGSAGSIYVFSYFPSGQIAAWGTYAPTYQLPVAAPAANYTASVVTYTGLTPLARYAWLPGAHEVSLTCGSVVLKQEGAFTVPAGVTTATIAGSSAAVTFTGALSLTTPFVPTKFSVFNGQVYARAGDNVFLLGGADNLTYDNCGVNWTMPYIDSGSPATKKDFESIDCAFQGTWTLKASMDYTTNAYRVVYQNTSPSFLLGTIGWGVAGTHYSFAGIEAGSGYALFSSVICHAKAQDEG